MKFRKFASVYCIFIGSAMIILWLVLLLTGKISELGTGPLEIAFHLFSEALTSVLLIASGLCMKKKKKGILKLYAFSLGMLSYSSINTAGYYLQNLNWTMLDLFACIFAAALILIVFGQEWKVNGDYEELEKLEQLIGEALVRNDYKFLDGIYAENYVCTSATGNRTDKTSAMKEIISPEVIIKLYTNKVSEIKILGEAAVVIGESKVKGHFGNKNLSGAYRYTHIYKRNQMEWQLCAAHMSKYEA